ncbi:MAG TPA: cytochrome C oxidase subunit IV family protein [Phototrophicaceae bacterium]|jgi:cytochrome c oxidase subunit 4|nr:cytochrome C oxidase subunit IV family protein [Phototrophicaceae bacterium]
MSDEHNTAETTHAPEASGHHDDSTTVLLGRVLPYPIYTVVFMILGGLTVVEIIIAQIIQVEWLKLPLLLGLALTKAILVILYYMHLRHDSRFFAAALILPVLVALLSMLYLLGIPPTGY